MKVRIMNISELKQEEPFMSLFPIDTDVSSQIRLSMRSGYDESQPITIWKGRNIVIDGHTRLDAAWDLFLETIPVFERDFKDENEALAYTLHNQRDRRNLKDSHILHLVEKLDKLRQRGGDRRSTFATTKVDPIPDHCKEMWSREETARKIGITADKVSQARHVLQNCSDAEIKQIKDGKRTLYSVYRGSLAAKENEEKKSDKQETTRKRLEEFKTKDFPCTNSKEDNHRHAVIAEKLLALADKLFPNIEKRASDICEIESIVNFFKSDDETFRIFCEQEPVKRFLRSLFVLTTIDILRCFGYKVATPRSLKLTPEQPVVPVKNRRPVPPPHRNIARIWEPDYVDPKKWDELSKSMERAVQRDIEEGRIKLD